MPHTVGRRGAGWLRNQFSFYLTELILSSGKCDAVCLTVQTVGCLRREWYNHWRQVGAAPPLRRRKQGGQDMAKLVEVKRNQVKAASARFEKLLAKDPEARRERREQARLEREEKTRRNREYAATRPKARTQKRRAKR